MHFFLGNAVLFRFGALGVCPGRSRSGRLFRFASPLQQVGACVEPRRNSNGSAFHGATSVNEDRVFRSGHEGDNRK